MTIDFQNCFIFILLCLLTFFYYYVLFKKTKNSKLDYSFPPSPPSWPVIGHLHLLISFLSHKALQRISKKYGPLLYLRIFTHPIVLVSSATVAYEIHRTLDSNVSSRVAATLDESIVFGSSGFITAPYGDYWKFMKKLISTKLLRPQAMEKSQALRTEEINRFYFYLNDKATKKESVEIVKETMKFNNNMICKMSMGRRCSEENGEAERVRELVTKSFAISKKYFFANLFRRPLEKLGISLFKKEIMSVSHGYDELLERILVEHEEKLEEVDDDDKDMMDLLLEAYRDEKAEFKITRNHIKSLFVDIFLGGTDTSAQTTQWTMAEIINKPKILERIRDEIEMVVGKTRLVQETDLQSLPYLKAVIKEGLRLHPPGPLVVRTFLENCEIKGFYVPQKATLIINVYALMRDPNFWEDPDEFKPERFLPSLKTEKEEERREKALKYLPFGLGRRGCPGENLGYIFLGTTIGMMVQCFDWKIKGDGKISMEEAVKGLTLAMAHPLTCTPVARALNLQI